MLSKKIGLDHILPRIRDSRISMRVDFNVPLKENEVKDVTRIKETIPSLKKIIEQQPKGIILMSHLGRPNGQVNPAYSLKPVVPVLEDLLQKKITFIDNVASYEALNHSMLMKNQEVVLLENVRFHKEEEGSFKDENGKKIKADPRSIQAFRTHLNSLGDIYVNDAFGTSHRAHSSIVGVTCPIRAAGDLLKKELDYFSKALETPKKPFLVILGGAKVSDKIPLINNLLDKVDEMIIGGAMAFTFLKIQGVSIGNSLVDNDSIQVVKDILKKAQEKNVKIHLPVDFIAAGGLQSKDNIQIFTVEQGISDGLMGLDAGEKTIKLNHEIIKNAKTIVWNGPQGAFENPMFAKASTSCVESLIQATRNGTITIAGGGDTLNLLKQVEGSKVIYQIQEKLSHVSTGGGASLELLEGKNLPGVEHLTNIYDLHRL